MKNTLILHGKPPRERYENPELPKPHEANWLRWLADELEKQGIDTAIPAFPRPYAPDYEEWKQVFEELAVDQDTGIVCHSASADFALHWLSENKEVIVERLVLVAPWHDSKGKYGDFSQYSLDTQLARRIGRISILSSSDDSVAITENVARIMSILPGTHHIQLEGFGHFMLGNNMPSVEFPELLEEVDK
jgi:predicted alpha/beta hydrolase family esterase